MKKNIFKLILAALLITPASTHAQSIKDILSKVISKTTTSNSTSTKSSSNGTISAVKDILGNVLGTQTVTPQSIEGTWTYKRPAIIFESSNVLNKIGGSVASSNIENKIATYLQKVGIKEGALIMTFNKDNTFTAKCGTKTTTGTYTLEGSNITLAFKLKKSVKANVKLSGNDMQLTFKADKLLTLLQGLEKVSSINSSIATITKLLKMYDGLQLGLQFSK